MFPKNFWYVAGWDHEIKSQPFARTICGEDIVFYRKADRSLVALEDCCPHRLLPLSKGFVQNDRLVCGYHGLEFDDSGACVHMPNQDRIPAQICSAAYTVAERHRFVWVWIGDQAQADEAKIPDLNFCSDPDWAFDGDMYHIACDYRLLVDNLMDLTHETYVHPTSIGQHEITEAPIETTHDETSVTLKRWMLNIEPPPFWASNLKSSDPCDRWQICNFTLPANVMIDVGVAKAGSGAPEGDRSQGVTGIVVDLMTPETENSTWYFWGMARNFEVSDQGLSLRIKDAQSQVFAEDLDVLESQQRNIEARPDQKLMNFNIDSGGVRARRLIDQAMADE
jgi:vanillate O-demethylase monooxygenase subunit